jgi:hypothetical protein
MAPTDGTAPTGGTAPTDGTGPTAARRFADRYVEMVNRGAYEELAGLFAPDALFLAPGRRELHGRSEIAAFYLGFLPEIRPTIRIASYVEDGNDCVYELEATTTDSAEFTLGAIDHATLDHQGRVVRFTVFTK